MWAQSMCRSPAVASGTERVLRKRKGRESARLCTAYTSLCCAPDLSVMEGVSVHPFCGSTWQHLSMPEAVVLSLRDPRLLGTVLPSFGICPPVPIALQCLHDLSMDGLSSLLSPQHLLTGTLAHCRHSDSSC